MPAALFVERDAAYVVLPQSLRFTCTREEWDRPTHRQRAIDRAWAAGIESMRATGRGGAELVCPAPVSLYYDSGDLVCAALRSSPTARPQLLTPDGDTLLMMPLMLDPRIIHTTYRNWAEGPLPHIELMSSKVEMSADDRRVLDSLPNRALREKMLQIMGPGALAPEAQTTPGLDDKVDFRIRGFFRSRDYKAFQSLQAADGHKLVLTDGTVFDGRDGESAEGLLED